MVGVRVGDVREAGGKTEGAWGCAPGIGSESETGLEDGDREGRGTERDGKPISGESACSSASEMTPLASEITPVSMKSAWGVASTGHVAAVSVGAWSKSVGESHECLSSFGRLRGGLVDFKYAGAVCGLEDVVVRPLPPVGAIAVDCQSCGDTVET